MTNQEFNRDCKRLLKMSLIDKIDEEKIKKEISRLHGADKEFCYANKTSILTLLRLNLRYRVIPLRNFGLRIELETL